MRGKIKLKHSCENFALMVSEVSHPFSISDQRQCKHGEYCKIGKYNLVNDVMCVQLGTQEL